MSRSVLVTGASGFVGVHACAALRAAGWSVTPVSRAGAAAAVRFDGQRVERDLAEHLAAADAVVYLGGRAHVLRETAADPRGAFMAANAAAPSILARAAASAGVATFLYVSSVAAVSNRATTRVHDADPAPPDTLYGESKLAGERAVAEAAGGTMRVLSLRPPMLYGEGMKGNPLRLFRHIARGLPVPVLTPEARRSMMYVGNLAAALALALDRGIRGEWCLSDGPPLTISEFVRAAAAAMGRRARILRLPARVLAPAARVGDLLSATVPFPLTSDTLSRLGSSLEVDGTRFDEATGFNPPHDRRASMERTAHWFLSTKDAATRAASSNTT